MPETAPLQRITVIADTLTLVADSVMRTGSYAVLLDDVRVVRIDSSQFVEHSFGVYSLQFQWDVRPDHVEITNSLFRRSRTDGIHTHGDSVLLANNTIEQASRFAIWENYHGGAPRTWLRIEGGLIADGRVYTRSEIDAGLALHTEHFHSKTYRAIVHPLIRSLYAILR